MKEIYRIKKGKLICKKHEVPIDFGLIFEDDGYFFFDFYISESYDILSLIESDDEPFSREEFSMSALTEDNNEVYGVELSATNVAPYQSKISMQSYGHLSHVTLQTDMDGMKIEYNRDDNPTLYYLEVEGLKMEFSDFTEITRARKGVQIKDFNSWKRDHTEAMLIYNSPNFVRNHFQIKFFKHQDNENIIIAFPNHRDNPPNIIPYNIFKEIKRDFISLLSLLNGAEVAVRKEFIGGFYQDNVNSQELITYSFKKIRNERYNTYIPLSRSRGNILSHVFIHCFNKYVEENKKLDFNSIIFYLSGAQKSNRIEEKFFVQIIAFERLAQKYIETLDEPETFIISDDNFKIVKEDLVKVLKEHSGIIGDKLNALARKIGELNKAKGVKYKFIKLLEYAEIPITEDIKELIDKVRHKTVHRGDIGKDGIKHFLVLDELLRDIILNIIGYNRERASRLRQDSPPFSLKRKQLIKPETTEKGE